MSPVWGLARGSIAVALGQHSTLGRGASQTSQAMLIIVVLDREGQLHNHISTMKGKATSLEIIRNYRTTNRIQKNASPANPKFFIQCVWRHFELAPRDAFVSFIYCACYLRKKFDLN